MKRIYKVILLLLVLLNLTSCTIGKTNRISVVERLNRADKLYSKGKFGEAEKLYLEITKSYGDSPEAYLKLSKVYRARRDFKKEEEILRQGIENTEYTNDLRELLIDLYLNQYKDLDGAKDEILGLLEANLHSYKFEFIRDEYKDYMQDERFRLIISVYNNNGHEDRMPIYLMKLAEQDPSEKNLELAFDGLKDISLDDIKPSMQSKLLNFYMRYGSSDQMENILTELSDTNKEGSIFAAYDHWVRQYQGEYNLEDVLRIDINGDGIEDNVILLTKDREDGGKEYAIEIQEPKTSKVYDVYSGISNFDELRLEYPLQDDPDQHVVNLVQTRTDDEFEFIDVFLISDRKISKPFN